MSDAVIKNVRRSSSRSVSHDTSSTKTGKPIGRSARSAPIVKRTTAEKAPVQKAVKSKATTGATSGSKSTKSTGVKRSSQFKEVKESTARATKTKSGEIVRTARKSSKKIDSKRAKSPTKSLTKIDVSVSLPQQTSHQAAALRAFETAHKAFSRAQFTEARRLFRAMIEIHTGAAEVVARARTYLAITEARLRTGSALPRDADGLYDRGVVELNSGEYAAAQELFERAVKREPGAAHIHYGLAATRARLGAISLALQSLEHALNIQPSLRIRAQNDQDLVTLRHEPEFERIVFVLR